MLIVNNYLGTSQVVTWSYCRVFMCTNSISKLLRVQGCARFPEILQNFSARQMLWSLCLVVLRALTLRLPIQTALSVAPQLPICARSGEKNQKISKTGTPQRKSLRQ